MKARIALTPLATAIAFGLFAVPAHAASPLTTEQRPLGAFSAIQASVPYHLVIKAQGAPSLSLSGPKEKLDNIETVISDDTLVIRNRAKFNFTFNLGRSQAEAVTIMVSAPMLKALKLSGSGDVDLDQLASSPATNLPSVPTVRAMCA